MYIARKEEKAGELRVADTPERVSAEIVALAAAVLGETEYQKAGTLAEKFYGTGEDKAAARCELLEMLEPPPERPLYYAQWEGQFLPRWARDIVRILGDFIYRLVKAAILEKPADSAATFTSLQQALDTFEDCWAEEKELAGLLRSFNSALYQDMTDVAEEGYIPHRFNARDAAWLTYIAVTLAERITRVSHLALNVRFDREGDCDKS